MILIPRRMALGKSDTLRFEVFKAADLGTDGDSDDDVTSTHLHTWWTVCISEGVIKIGILNVSIVVSIQISVSRRLLF